MSSNNRNNMLKAHPKRTRGLASFQKMTLDETIDEEDCSTLDTAPDHISTSTSEASSMRSNASQPPLLDFIGNTCEAAAWFTSCFPCAVVDFNDNDDYVVDKLSRESAMNVMYANSNHNIGGDSNSLRVTPDSSPLRGHGKRSQYMEDDKNVIYVRLPEQLVKVDEPLHTVPSVIQEDINEDETMDEVSLIDDPGTMAQLPRLDRTYSGNVDLSKPAVPAAEAPKKKRFGVKKLFRKKKA